MKTTLIAMLLITCPLAVTAADAVPFAEATPKRDIESRVSLSLKVGEMLYIKLAKGFLIISIDDIIYKNEGGGPSESCVISTTHIENDRVTSESKKSFVVYSAAEEKDGRRELTVVDGTQDFRKAGIQFSWSYASRDSIFFYVPPKTKYAITAEQE